MTNTSRDSGGLFPGLDDGPGPAVPIAESKARSMIAAAMAGGVVPPGGEGAAGGGGSAISASGPGASAGFKIGAAALIVSAAVVGTLVLTRGSDSAPTPTPTPSTSAPIAAPSDAPPDPPTTSPPRATPVKRPRTTPAPAPSPRRKPAVRAVTTPEDLLRKANQSRKQRNWREAYALYGQVMRTHRGSRAAYVATVASAQLKLGKLGQPSHALRLFARALRQEPRGSLTEEARFGIAEAHRKLGNKSSEAKSLQLFLRHHKGSPLARRAKARLATVKGDEDQ